MRRISDFSESAWVLKWPGAEMTRTQRETGAGVGGACTMSRPPSQQRVPEAAPNDVLSMLKVVYSHQRQHEDGSVDITKCRTMLGKLKKVLPKLSRPISAAPTQDAVLMTKQLCELLQLLIHARACPHAHVVLLDDIKRDSDGNDGQNTSAEPTKGVVTQSFSTIATHLLSLVSFYCNERLQDAQDRVRDTIVELVVLLQSRDVYAAVHVFQDSVDLLEDCLLLEECLRRSELAPEVGSAQIACYLNTVIHTFHGSDGPLGSTSTNVMCGCIPIDDEAAAYSRRQHLRELLPAIPVASHSSAVNLRKTIQHLLSACLDACGTEFLLDQSAQRLCVLVETAIQQDRDMLPRGSEVSDVNCLPRSERFEVAESTCTLMAHLFRVAHHSERCFLRVAQAFFSCACVFCEYRELDNPVTVVLGQISAEIPRLSHLCKEELWEIIELWVTSSMHVEFRTVDCDSDVGRLIPHQLLSICEQLMADLKESPVWIALDIFQAQSVHDFDEDAQSSLINIVHTYVTAQNRLSRFARKLAKSMISQQYQQSVIMSRGSRKRRRPVESSSPITSFARDDNRMCDELCNYLIDLLFATNQTPQSTARRISTALRLLLPLRPLLETIARVETQAVMREVLSRVDVAIRSFGSEDSRLGTVGNTDLILILLTHMPSSELHRFQPQIERHLSWMAGALPYTDIAPIEGISSATLFSIVDGVHALRGADVSPTSDAMRKWLRRCHGLSGAVLKVNPNLRALLVAILSWIRCYRFDTNAPHNKANQLITRLTNTRTQSQAQVAYISLLPTLIVFVDDVQSVEGREHVLQCLVDLILTVPNADCDQALDNACLEAIQRAVCCSTIRGWDHDQFTVWSKNPMGCCPMTTHEGQEAFTLPRKELCERITVFAEHKRQGLGGHALVHEAALLSSLVHHGCHSQEWIREIVLDRVIQSTVNENKIVRRVAVRALRSCVSVLSFRRILGQPGPAHVVTELLGGAIDSAIKSREFLLLESTLEVIGVCCCAMNLESRGEREFLIWGILKLLTLWIKTHSALRPVATAAFDQIGRVFESHKISWPRLFAEYPSELYFFVVDALLRTDCLKRFVAVFFGPSFDEAILLDDSAPWVIPRYVIEQQSDMLETFLQAHNGFVVHDDVVMIDDSLGPSRLPTKSLKELLNENIAYILKELLLHQVQVEDNDKRMKEWHFLLNSLEQNTTIRDAIDHVSLRLLKLLAWELGGEQSDLAKRAFREISSYLTQDTDQEHRGEGSALTMPRQFFLALMTDLGNKINGEPRRETRIRAIRSIGCLFRVFRRKDDEGVDDLKGAFDPFVPKVMAILKVGLHDKALQDDAVHAWGIFIRMLTTKALESNFVSLVVSVLPCIGNGVTMEHGYANQPTDESDGSLECSVYSTAMLAAVRILKYLFVDRLHDLKHAFPRVRLIPSVAALDEVHASYIAEIGDPARSSLADYLTNCLPYVSHWDLAVREIVLSEIYQTLISRADELRLLLHSEDDYVHPTILEILFALLYVARTDTTESVRSQCAKCLGALGAIDGARIPLNILRSTTTSLSLLRDRPETRLEYSTKDLACVLIENWLVKELRAAPENTDEVAFSIQELLKFLAELTEDPQHNGQTINSGLNNPDRRARSKNGPPMPEWMKRRFERKDVLEFVEPYWYTNYSIDNEKKVRMGSELTFYEKYSSTYEEWLYGWCRRLIELSKPPERKIFQACQMVLSTSAQIGRFLLPYLLQNVLCSGRPEVYEEVKREIMAVLSDNGVMDDRAGSTGSRILSRSEDAQERAFGEYASRHHQCAQTIMATIDELNEWVWNSEKKRLALSAGRGSTAQTQAKSGEITSELDDEEKENLEEFLKDIPSQALSSAAFRIKAFARALQYFEVYLRQQQPPQSAESAQTNGLLTMLPVDLKLISKHATYLQQLYSKVEEPDALTGLATLRRLHMAHSPSDPTLEDEDSSLVDLLHQVVDHEQLAQWEDALACYEQAIQEVHSAQTSYGFYGSLPDGDGDSHQGKLVDLGDTKDPRSIKPALYSGIVRCLIQLGRLESALQHINGIVTQEPQYVGTLYPHALECAWRLSRWELVSELLNTERQTSLLSNSLVQGGVSSRFRNLDVSQLSLVRVLNSFHEGNYNSFAKNLQEARVELMGPLAAACAESYQRAYPLLHKLHFLHEAEQGFISVQQSKDLELEARRQRWLEQCPWEARYDLLSPSLKFRDPILALRRVMLEESDLRLEVSQNWLSYAKLARKEGFIRTANSAVMHAEALDNPYASLEKAKLLVTQNRMYEALQIIEPVDIDASKIAYNVEDPHFCAKNLLLATNWMQESGQRQGRKVIERYEAVIKFDPKWEKGYFFLAKYYEYLLSVSHPEAPTTISSSNGSRNDDVPLNIDSTFHSHLINLMKNYVLALSHGTKHLFQALPRLLTLWFEYGELLQQGSNKGTVNKAMRSIEIELSQSSTEQQIMADLTNVIQNASETLPAYEWLVCFPQVTSRICHPNPIVVDGVKKIMMRVLLTYPTQAMWPLLGLSRSLNSQRRNRARDIIAATQRQFVSSEQQEVANSFAEGMRLAEELISLAGHDPANQRKIHIRLSRIRTRILVPVQATLNTVLPSSGLASDDNRHAAFMPHSQVHIKTFSDKADVMMTKEKPKRIEVLGTDGQLYPFLCKREKTGDLRKDARMMEFNTMINKLLQKDREGRKRKLRLRTYAVVCLNEESGLMEWVRHTKAMRQLIGQIHKTERGFIQPVRLTHDIKERFLGMQKKYANDPVMLALYFRRKILSLPTFTPRFHQWFTNNFSDPTAWFEARLTFSRSAAVWSMVGHIIGLGDRHGENILIDCTNGECVHVDFDCLFDKGLKLAKPEIVPFRLTPNIIDAFGITGYEGVFRRVCEVTMELLRANKETLRSVLESFIHDPLVEWGRRGKNAQGMASNAAGRSIADIPSDRSKEETRIILKTIDDRLRGIYNLGDAIRPLVSSSHRSLLPENETLPLSVQGQVDKLIHEATAHENLAQMYIGWMPFL